MSKKQRNTIIVVAIILIVLYLIFKDKLKGIGVTILPNKNPAPDIVEIETQLQPEPELNPINLTEFNQRVTGTNYVDDNIYPETMYLDSAFSFNSFDGTTPRAMSMPLQKRRTQVELEPHNFSSGVIKTY